MSSLFSRKGIVMDRHKILLALDRSPASAPAIENVARSIRAGQVARVVLAYVLAPIPPKLLEHGGGDTPQEEREKQARLDRERDRWIRSAERSAREPMRRAHDALRRAGLAEEDIAEQFLSVVHDADIVQSLLETARELECRSIVVAREAFPWYREHHVSGVADHLQRDAVEETVIVVSEPGEAGAVGPAREAGPGRGKGGAGS
jgi:hypothetical protein